MDYALIQSRFGAPFEAILRSYSQIFFSRSKVVGALLLLATGVDLRVMAMGLLAAIVAWFTTVLLRLDTAIVKEGIYGYNAVLVGLGTSVLLADNQMSVVVTIAASVMSVFVMAAARTATSLNGLPVLTLPFLAVYYLVIATSTSLGFSMSLLPPGPEISFLPGWLALYLKSLGMILFLPRLDAGLILLGALVFHSRIATMLSLIGLAVAYVVMQIGPLSVMMGDTFPMLLALNIIFTAIAIGGGWFVPSWSATGLALVASAAAAAMTISTAPILARFGLPILILPFNLTVWLVLYGFRQRTEDAFPKSVNFLPGTPEQNFVFYRTRVLRFGAHYAVRLRAPFAGTWTCTQGVDGEFTHKGEWRHAFDFEVVAEGGLTYRSDGATPGDYYCYNLPVLAPAGGSVVAVVNDVPDNPIGQPNLTQNWGNLVLLYHAPGLYTLLCHLIPGSIKVHVGQWVVAGQELGRCGNSGRSPVPHLHMHLQALPRIGAPTIRSELHDVVEVSEPHSTLRSAVVVQKGQHIRNLRVESSIEHRFQLFTPGTVFELYCDQKKETIEVVVDLYGRKLMQSSRGSTLTFELEEDRFVVIDVEGSSVGLHVLRGALARVPFDDTPDLEWSDHLPFSLVFGRIISTLYEFVAPFVDRGGVEMVYKMHQDNGDVIVEGRSLRGGDKPWVKTRAVLNSAGLKEVCIQTLRRTFKLTSVPEAKVQK